MEIWMIIPILLIAIALVFLSWVIYRIGFIKGYKAGAMRVINEWKESIHYEEEN